MLWYSSDGMTPIKDVLFNTDGTPVADASVSISFPRFTAADGRSIAQSTIRVKVTNGIFIARLEPTPPGVHYDVRFSVVSTGSNWQERWVVPDSETPLKFTDLVEKK